ncbi:MAG: flavodoxin family protein [Lachnospiraceae bacterium]|nr:flavodoxin family protein [Lachnospiraceae bacterium]
MSRILILTGSPRKNGNTDRLAASFAEGAGKHNEVKIISVHDLDINPCTGCNCCYLSEGNKCFQNDDMAEVYDAMSEADVLVIASPVYFYGLSAQLKAMIDRLHTPMRNTFHIKKLGLILVGAAELPEMFDAIITQYRLALNFFKLEDAGTVLARGARDKGDVRNDDLEAAYRLGSSIT